MKVGDLVLNGAHAYIDDGSEDSYGVVIEVIDVKCWGFNSYGVVIEVIDELEVPPVCRVLWASGEMNKIYEDELEVIDGNE